MALVFWWSPDDEPLLVMYDASFDPCKIWSEEKILLDKIREMELGRN